jgi:hypothetical protein
LAEDFFQFFLYPSDSELQGSPNAGDLWKQICAIENMPATFEDAAGQSHSLLDADRFGAFRSANREGCLGVDGILSSFLLLNYRAFFCHKHEARDFKENRAAASLLLGFRKEALWSAALDIGNV